MTSGQKSERYANAQVYVIRGGSRGGKETEVPPPPNSEIKIKTLLVPLTITINTGKLGRCITSVPQFELKKIML